MTSFIARRLKVKIILGARTFRDGSNAMEISNARIIAEIHVRQGREQNANITIFGLHPDNMNSIMTLKGLDPTGTNFTKPNLIQLFMIDSSGNELSVYEGQIFEALVDYNSAPNVPIRIAAMYITPNVQGASNSPDNKNNQKHDGHSLKGSWKVADIATEIIRRYNESHKEEKQHRLVNNGVDLTLTDYAIAGASLFDEFTALKQATNIEWHIKDTPKDIEIHINPPGMPSQNESEIILSKDNGMIGYPVLTMNGCNVKALYSPFYSIQSPVRVQSMVVRFLSVVDTGTDKYADYVLPEMTFTITQMVHRISSEMPGGPWETEFMLNRFVPQKDNKQ